ncbi:Rv3235 family protein [Propionicicella superfundia]|uniref:Rv3235 family protein n=1 Tax=Propionicicella superfundia TaxID=348582 RepID=UPI0006875229|nr:Rv3235 family protein [Propionicicella superfundia]
MPHTTPRATVDVLADPRPAGHRLVAAYDDPCAFQPALPATPVDAPRVRILSRIDPVDRQAILSLTQAVIEALQGRRPTSQLERWAHPDIAATIGHLQRAGRESVLVFRSVRLQPVSSTVVEVAAHLVAGGRSRAVALRLARGRVPGRWLCTRFETALWTATVTRAGESA